MSITAESHWYTVSEETFAKLNSMVTPGHRLTPVAQFIGGGLVRFPLEPDTVDHHRQPGETDDQLVYRVLGGLSQ